MKIIVSLFVLFCLFSGRELVAQEFVITGTWTMFEMSWTSGDEIVITNEEQLKNKGWTMEYYFIPDGKFNMVSNMSDSVILDTVEGTWKLEGDKLTCNFRMGEVPLAVIYDLEFKDNYIQLKQTFPDGLSTAVNSFKRKQ